MSSTAPTTVLSAVSDRTSARYSLFSTAPSLGPSIAGTTASETTLLDEKTATTIASPPLGHAGAGTRPNSTRSASVQDARAAELKSWAATFERLSDQRLESQRFVPTNNKNDELSVNAIGAKLERALDRRMSGQDAVFRSRSIVKKTRLAAS